MKKAKPYARGSRLPQIALILSTLAASWLAMQAVHELGHVLGATFSGGQVANVVLHPLTTSRTDVAPNPHPLLVAWAGPIFGVLTPLAMWGAFRIGKMRGAFVMRFFAGFCLIANGMYVAGGSLDGVGDAGEMLRHGAPIWLLGLFGVATAPLGLWLWHGQGEHFGFGSANGVVDRCVAYCMLGGVALLASLGLLVGR